ncbi:hypothetical protein [Chenggangzhangella methanolivorans]|uniref:Uncharacterized protein n=1 Tax=Chenggangzhangella methanolivorans TaxID=1437009 RepID=A0A9E6R7R7_9HYPH|nr:hypothetical protein [Chenggangzhangella methanolivorans]QZN99770.1 hypothetical protein K6K41_24400 [Chenggangzhangella methanolivorans]
MTPREAGLRAREMIAAERERQVAGEGYSAAHDDRHRNGSLLAAARIYLHHGTDGPAPLGPDGQALVWPWEPDSFKPRDRISNLVRAGALCKAEIARRVRAGISTVPAHHKLQAAMAELALALRAAEPSA